MGGIIFDPKEKEENSFVWESGKNHEQSRLSINPLAWIGIDKFITIQKSPCHRRFRAANKSIEKRHSSYSKSSSMKYNKDPKGSKEI
jgi:hypothetical protein